MTWVKQRSGNHRQFHSNAYYTVHTKEMIMVGVKGTPRCEWNSKISNVFFAVRDGHNQKPDAIHEIVEKLFGMSGKFVEIFARRNNLRVGWLSIGNEL